MRKGDQILIHKGIVTREQFIDNLINLYRVSK
jgi:hypothetical protein